MEKITGETEIRGNINANNLKLHSKLECLTDICSMAPIVSTHNERCTQALIITIKTSTTLRIINKLHNIKFLS